MHDWRDYVWWPIPWRWLKRIDCHGTTRPCQYIDHPMCNRPRREEAR